MLKVPILHIWEPQLKLKLAFSSQIWLAIEVIQRRAVPGRIPSGNGVIPARAKQKSGHSEMVERRTVVPCSAVVEGRMDRR